MKDETGTEQSLRPTAIECRLPMLALLALLAVASCSQPAPRPAPPGSLSVPPEEVAVTFVPPADGAQEVSGNLILLLSEKDYGSRPESPGLIVVYGGALAVSKSIRLRGGQSVRIPPPEGTGTLCAYVDSNRDFMMRPGPGAGSWYSSDCIAWPPSAASPGSLTIDAQRSPPSEKPLPDGITDHALENQIPDHSDSVRFLVMVPPAYETSGLSYPVLYVSHGFNGDRFSFLELLEVFRQIMVETEQDMIVVSTEARGRFGHHQFVNSEANGPMQDLFIDKLVPWVDANYRTVANRNGRGFFGHSSGGWAALSLLLRASEVIGYGFAASPDPIHLETWWRKHPDNVYLNQDGSEHMLVDIPGLVQLSFRQWVGLEVRTGSFGQVAGFLAVLAPYRPESEGLPFLMPFDLESGKVDPEGWKALEKSDLYPLTKARPEKSREALSGRLFLYVGDKDEVGLFEPAREYSELLNELKIPHQFRVFEGAHHIDYLGRKEFLAGLWQTAWDCMRKAAR